MLQKVKKDPFITFDQIDVNNVSSLIKSGSLSGFLGSPSGEFYGGEYVRRLESPSKRKV